MDGLTGDGSAGTDAGSAEMRSGSEIGGGRVDAGGAGNASGGVNGGGAGTVGNGADSGAPGACHPDSSGVLPDEKPSGLTAWPPDAKISNTGSSTAQCASPVGAVPSGPGGVGGSAAGSSRNVASRGERGQAGSLAGVSCESTRSPAHGFDTLVDASSEHAHSSSTGEENQPSTGSLPAPAGFGAGMGGSINSERGNRRSNDKLHRDPDAAAPSVGPPISSSFLFVSGERGSDVPAAVPLEGRGFAFAQAGEEAQPGGGCCPCWRRWLRRNCLQGRQHASTFSSPSNGDGFFTSATNGKDVSSVAGATGGATTEGGSLGGMINAATIGAAAGGSERAAAGDAVDACTRPHEHSDSLERMGKQAGEEEQEGRVVEETCTKQTDKGEAWTQSERGSCAGGKEEEEEEAHGRYGAPTKNWSPGTGEKQEGRDADASVQGVPDASAPLEDPLSDARRKWRRRLGQLRWRPSGFSVVLLRSDFMNLAYQVLCRFRYEQPTLISDLMLACRLQERSLSVTVLLCGTSGCGKSTLASLLASRLGITTVISTDSIRHMMRGFVGASACPLLWASTYHAGDYLQTDAVPGAPGGSSIGGSGVGSSGSGGQGQMGVGRTSLESVDGEQLSQARQLTVKGYKAQSEMILDSLDRLIGECERRNESLVVEGVHLSLNFVVGLMRRHPTIIPFLVYISNEAKHRERFAVRAKYMTLEPSQNKYIKHFRNIRTIQDYLCVRAEKKHIPKIDNTSVDRSVIAMHATVFGCIRRLACGEPLLDAATNTATTVFAEFERQRRAVAWSSKAMLRIIQRGHMDPSCMGQLGQLGCPPSGHALMTGHADRGGASCSTPSTSSSTPRQLPDPQHDDFDTASVFDYRDHDMVSSDDGRVDGSEASSDDDENSDGENQLADRDQLSALMGGGSGRLSTHRMSLMLGHRGGGGEEDIGSVADSPLMSPSAASSVDGDGEEDAFIRHNEGLVGTTAAGSGGHGGMAGMGGAAAGIGGVPGHAPEVAGSSAAAGRHVVGATNASDGQLGMAGMAGTVTAAGVNMVGAATGGRVVGDEAGFCEAASMCQGMHGEEAQVVREHQGGADGAIRGGEGHANGAHARSRHEGPWDTLASSQPAGLVGANRDSNMNEIGRMDGVGGGVGPGHQETGGVLGVGQYGNGNGVGPCAISNASTSVGKGMGAGGGGAFDSRSEHAAIVAGPPRLESLAEKGGCSQVIVSVVGELQQQQPSPSASAKSAVRANLMSRLSGPAAMMDARERSCNGEFAAAPACANGGGLAHPATNGVHPLPVNAVPMNTVSSNGMPSNGMGLNGMPHDGMPINTMVNESYAPDRGTHFLANGNGFAANGNAVGVYASNGTMSTSTPYGSWGGPGGRRPPGLEVRAPEMIKERIVEGQQGPAALDGVAAVTKGEAGHGECAEDGARRGGGCGPGMKFSREKVGGLVGKDYRKRKLDVVVGIRERKPK
eukprot:jgi/Mesvir1/17180/Mv07601-RA.1